MKTILVLNLIILLMIMGCAGSNCYVSTSENAECQRLKVLWERIGKENPQIIIPETESESGDEMAWQELGELVFSAVGCCFCTPHPLAMEWMEYKRLECVWENLENERVQKIAFAKFSALESEFDPPELRHSPEDQRSWAEIVEPQKINEVLKLLREALKEGNNKFANEGAILSVSFRDQMQIVTDKHKYIIPVYFKGEITYGIGWTSKELREKLREWGFADPKW